MTPIVALVGRANVGKSTLFNRLVPGRTAVVDDTPGTTRDRHYARTDHGGREFLLVDTGGFEPRADDPLRSAVRVQTELAVEEADVIVYLGDAKDGLLPDDHAVIDRLRRSGKPVIWAINKVDTERRAAEALEFSEAGIAPLVLMSTAHGRGVTDVCDAIVAALPEMTEEEKRRREAEAETDAEAEAETDPDSNVDSAPDSEEDRDFDQAESDPDSDVDSAPGAEADSDIRLAVVGRPNVGKSSLVNRLLGEPRHLVTDVPGTTVDAIDSALEVDGQRFVLVDTAGVRRKRSISTALEKVAVLRAFRAVEKADVAVLLLDPVAGPVDQDARLAGLAVEAGRGLVFCLNRWDLMPPGEAAAREAIQKVRDAFAFAPWAPVVRCSALTGRNVPEVLRTAARVHRESRRRISTGQLNRALAEMTAHHAPPASGSHRVKLYYITQASTAPPTFVVSANHPKEVHFSYRRYLQNQLRQRFGFEGVPVRVFYRPHRQRDTAPTRPSRTAGSVTRGRR